MGQASAGTWTKKLLSFAVSTSKFGSFEGAEAWGKPPLALGQKNY